MMRIQNMKINESEKLIGYFYNRITKNFCVVWAHRFSIDILNIKYIKYNFIKLYTLLQTIYSSAPGITLFLISINYNCERFLSQFNQTSLIPLLKQWNPNSLKLNRQQKFSWYKVGSIALLYVPDVYNNMIIINEARRNCIPILGLVNSRAIIDIDYPIYCNIYSVNIILWFSKYIIKIIQKESNFFRKQSKIYKPKILYDFWKIRWIKEISSLVNKKLHFLKIHLSKFRKKRETLTSERFYWRDVRSSFKNFWFDNFKRNGYRFKKWFFKYRFRVKKQFIKKYRGNYKYSTYLIRLLGKNPRYNRHNKWEKLKELKQAHFEPNKFMYDDLFPIWSKRQRRIKGYYMLKKTRPRYIKFMQYLQELWKKKSIVFAPYRDNIKKKILSFTYRKNVKMLRFWPWYNSKKYSPYLYNTSNNYIYTAPVYKRQYRWKINRSWLKYTYEQKFKNSNTSAFWYLSKFWGVRYINRTWRNLYQSITMMDICDDLVFNNHYFSQKGICIDNRQNLNYNSKFYIWLTNSQNFRKNLKIHINNIWTQGWVNLITKPRDGKSIHMFRYLNMITPKRVVLLQNFRKKKIFQDINDNISKNYNHIVNQLRILKIFFFIIQRKNDDNDD